MSDDDKRFRIDGGGFSRDDFTEEERAQIRHLIYRLSREFLTPDQFLEDVGLKGLSKIAKSFPVVITWAGGAAVLAGFFFTGQKLGWW